MHFEIGRNEDSIRFTGIAALPIKNTTAAEHHYSYVFNGTYAC